MRWQSYILATEADRERRKGLWHVGNSFHFGMPVADKEQLVANAGSCGLPYISIQTRIVDYEVRDVASGRRVVRGPSITK